MFPSRFKGLNDWYLFDYLKMWTTYDQRPTIINISPQTLTTELSSNSKYGVIGGIGGTGSGFLPTTAHESTHASQEVNYDPLFQPWINEAHDNVWKNVYIKFFQKLQQKYGKEVKNRFIEYRKIIGKEKKEH